MSAVDGSKRLLDDVDSLDEPSPTEQPRRSWCGRIMSVLGAAGSFGVTFVDSMWAKAIGSFATGFFAERVVECTFEHKSLERARKVLTGVVADVFPVLALSQVYANEDNDKLKDFAVYTIAAGFGVNLSLFLQSMIDQKMARVEVHALEDDNGEKLKFFLPNRDVVDFLKLLAVIANVALYYLFDDDPLFQAITALFASAYGAQIVGGRIGRRMIHKIKETDRGGTCYRTAQTIINALGFICTPLLAFPLTADPDTNQRRAQIPLMGLIELFGQFRHESLIERFKNFSIPYLKEFHSLHAPKEKELCYRVWRIAYRILSSLAVAGFGLWQIVVLTDRVEKLELGAMVLSFFATLGIYHFVDRKFHTGARHWLKDTLMVYLVLTPRIFAINPLLTSLLATNAEKIDSSQIILHEKSLISEVLAGFGWASTGFIAAHRLYFTTSEWVGPNTPSWLAIAYQFNTIRLKAEGVI